MSIYPTWRTDNRSILENISNPRCAPKRGDAVQTAGGAIGIYIGTSRWGTESVHYMDRARLSFRACCVEFDAWQERSRP